MILTSDHPHTEHKQANKLSQNTDLPDEMAWQLIIKTTARSKISFETQQLHVE